MLLDHVNDKIAQIKYGDNMLSISEPAIFRFINYFTFNPIVSLSMTFYCITAALELF